MVEATLSHTPHDPPEPPHHSVMRLGAVVAGQGLQVDLDPERAAELRANPENRVWLDIVDPGPDQIDYLRRQFGFHELALEDVAGRHQRPKCDQYEDGNYYFIVVYVGKHGREEVILEELEMFWGENYLVTVHDQPMELFDVVRRRLTRQPEQAGCIAPLVYMVFDGVVDSFLPLVDWIEERVEDIEESIFPRADTTVASLIFQTRKQLVRMRRVLAPTRDVLNEIIRRDLPIYPESLRPYFVDAYDHTLRALDQLDLYRDLLESALDVYLSATSNRLNQLVKRMTALTLLVMAPTLVAGIYGMNFKNPIPPYDSDYGFLFSVVVMFVLVAGGTVVFWRLDWL
jgi:magnesium transporter